MAGVAVVLYRNANGIAEAVHQEEFPEGTQALLKYADLVRDVVTETCGFKEFSHVEFMQASTSYQAGDITSPLALVIGSPLKNEEGELLGVTDVQHVLDILGALTATNQLPEVIADKVGLDEEGLLGFTDIKLSKVATSLNDRLHIADRFPETVTAEDEEAISEVLGSLVPEDTTLQPVHPEDLLSVLPAFLSVGAPAPRAVRGPGLLQRGRQLAGRVLSVAPNTLRLVGRRTHALRQSVWRVEDLVHFSRRLVLGVARRAAGPILAGLVLHRACKTISGSRNVYVRMAKLPPSERMDLFYSNLLGKDYNNQIEQDLLDAVKEVQEGLVTEDYKDEKRLLTAAMLRRLEVEEWDKERMKHFYYGSYGLGPWYFDMEERLHNPYFIGARAWNGPVEGWVNKNKVYPRDLPQGSTSFAEAALSAIEASTGRALTPSQRASVLAREKASAADVLLSKNGLLNGVLPEDKVQQHLAAAV